MPFIDPEKRREYMRSYRNKNRIKVRNWNKKWASENTEKRRKICRNSQRRNKEKRRNYYKNYMRKERIGVFSHYGLECSCCGEKEWLTIDHMDGGGTQHRKNIGVFGSSFYRWLRKNGYPQEYQTLCFNCNIGRSQNNGICPHLEIVNNISRYRGLMLEAYGNECSLCAEKIPHFLTVDHIDGDGANHRRKIGRHVLEWLKKENYPAGFRTLCWNCNCGLAKSKSGKYLDPVTGRYLNW